jgi:hypothetical protein
MNKLDKIKTLFINRTDAYAVQLEDGSYRPVRQSLDDTTIEAHLRGETTMGIYPLKEGQTKWVAADFDNKDDIGLALDNAVNLCETLHSLGIPSYLEFSGNKGFHTWIFFSSPVDAHLARKLVQFALNKASITEYEIFPKQDTASDLGNLIKMPLGIHRTTGCWCLFLDEELMAYEDQMTFIDSVKTIDAIPEFGEYDYVPEIVREANSQQTSSGLPCFSLMMEGVEEGQRNQVCYTLAKHFKRMGLCESDTVDILNKWNLRNSEPLSQKELEMTIASAFKSQDMGFDCDNPLIQPFCSDGCPVKIKRGQKTSVPKFYSAAEMPSVELQPVEWFIDGLIGRRRKNIVNADPKVGKGHLSEQLGLCLSDGITFLGEFPVVGKYRVLYLELESDQATLRDRVELKREALGASGSNFFYQAYEGEPILLDTIEGKKILRNILQGFKSDGRPLDYVIIDPKYRTIDGDLSLPKQVRPWTNNVDQLIKEFDIGFMLIDHQAKMSYDRVSKKGIGSILWSAWADLIWVLDRTGDVGTLDITGKTPEEITLKLERDPCTMLWKMSLWETNERTTKKQQAKMKILDQLQKYEIDENKIKSMVRAEGIGHSTFHNALTELLASGKIQSIPLIKNKRLLRLKS